MEERGTWPGPPNKMPKTRGDGEEQRPVNGVMVTRAQGREKQRANAGRAALWSQKPSAPQKGQKEIRLERRRGAGLPGPCCQTMFGPNAYPGPQRPCTRTPCLDRQHHAPHSS